VFDQLIQEQRNPVRELGLRHAGRGPLSHLEAAALDQVGAIAGEELMEHLRSVR
jgi:hypothetical protein